MKKRNVIYFYIYMTIFVAIIFKSSVKTFAIEPTSTFAILSAAYSFYAEDVKNRKERKNFSEVHKNINNAVSKILEALQVQRFTSANASRMAAENFIVDISSRPNPVFWNDLLEDYFEMRNEFQGYYHGDFEIRGRALQMMLALGPYLIASNLNGSYSSKNEFIEKTLIKDLKDALEWHAEGHTCTLYGYFGEKLSHVWLPRKISMNIDPHCIDVQGDDSRAPVNCPTDFFCYSATFKTRVRISDFEQNMQGGIPLMSGYSEIGEVIKQLKKIVKLNIVIGAFDELNVADTLTPNDVKFWKDHLTNAGNSQWRIDQRMDAVKRLFEKECHYKIPDHDLKFWFHHSKNATKEKFLKDVSNTCKIILERERRHENK